MMVIANVFPKLQNVKNLVRPLSKKHDFRTPFVSPHVQASQILNKSPCLFIVIREVDLENVSESYTLNVRGVC